jgi:hypothetical protein
MKKTITLLFAIFLALGISAQNFGVGLDFMMLSGTMIEDAEGNAVTTLDADGETVEASSSSAVLNVSYTHPLADKLDMVGSVGYGMMFGLVPVKLGVSYGIASNISANLGMGMYMITDDSYVPTGLDEEEGSSNEFGINLGVKYQMNNIGIGLGYDMIKGGEDYYTLNAVTIGISYGLGGLKRAIDTPSDSK